MADTLVLQQGAAWVDAGPFKATSAEAMKCQDSQGTSPGLQELLEVVWQMVMAC